MTNLRDSQMNIVPVSAGRFVLPLMTFSAENLTIEFPESREDGIPDGKLTGRLLPGEKPKPAPKLKPAMPKPVGKRPKPPKHNIEVEPPTRAGIAAFPKD